MLYCSPGEEALQPAFSLVPVVYDIGPRGEHVHSYVRLEIRTANQRALFPILSDLRAAPALSSQRSLRSMKVEILADNLKLQILNHPYVEG